MILFYKIRSMKIWHLHFIIFFSGNSCGPFITSYPMAPWPFSLDSHRRGLLFLRWSCGGLPSPCQSPSSAAWEGLDRLSALRCCPAVGSGWGLHRQRWPALVDAMGFGIASEIYLSFLYFLFIKFTLEFVFFVFASIY